MENRDNPFNVKVGEIWIENDPRHFRKVEVIDFSYVRGKAKIKSLKTGNITWASLKRFNGKRGGYMRDKQE
jgi:hypothetical protein